MFSSYEQQREFEDAIFNESMAQGQRMTAASREFARNAGQDRPDEEWLLTDRDTWERNPCYEGEPGPHPEDYHPEDWGSRNGHTGRLSGLIYRH